MDSNNKESPVPAPPVCKYSLVLDNCVIGFISAAQRSRFMKYRTYIDGRGQRHIISGLQSMSGGVQRAKGKYYFNRHPLSDKVGIYNYHKRVNDEKEL